MNRERGSVSVGVSVSFVLSFLFFPSFLPADGKVNVQTGINTARVVEVEEPVAVEGWAMGGGGGRRRQRKKKRRRVDRRLWKFGRSASVERGCS